MFGDIKFFHKKVTQNSRAYGALLRFFLPQSYLVYVLVKWSELHSYVLLTSTLYNHFIELKEITG